MTDVSTLLLHVADPAASADFYRHITDREPVEASDAFVLFLLSPGLALGLWRADAIDPPATGTTDSIEIGFKQNREGVDACHADWLARGCRDADAANRPAVRAQLRRARSRWASAAGLCAERLSRLTKPLDRTGQRDIELAHVRRQQRHAQR